MKDRPVEKYGEINDLESIAIDFQRNRLRDTLRAIIEIGGPAAAQREIKDACDALGISGKGKRGPRRQDALPAIKRLAQAYDQEPDAAHIDLATDADVAESKVSEYLRDKRFQIELIRLRDRRRREG